jgi:hypothetical protein
MAANGERIRVILKWVQILDNLEPDHEEHGEFVFRVRIVPQEGDPPRETRIPEKGHLEISDHPGFNRVPFDMVVFEGEVRDGLRVEIDGEELDTFTPNDHLDSYRREFHGPPSRWLGTYGPDRHERQAGGDPENMSNWRLAYTIERVAGA